MNVLTAWLRSYLPLLPVSDRQLADDLTLRGIAVEGVHPLWEAGADGQPRDGHLFEMDITTNRVDAMNHYGIAREAATIYGLSLCELETAEERAAAVGEGRVAVRVEPEARLLCGRFTAQVLRGIEVRPATGEVARYFGLLGQRAISGPVDASNFTLLGMGQPTHAFDLDKVEGGIVVRLARRGEVLRLLDGTTRTLEADDLVIADERKALSLAGVMGGWDSMITPETRNVLVESAWFDPASIRRSSRRHLLHTDASHRFERGADFNAAPVANRLVSELILRDCGGRRDGGLVDVSEPEVGVRTADRAPVRLRVSAARRLLGATVEDRVMEDGRVESGLTLERIERTLESLGCRMEPVGAETFQVGLPSWRLDLEREVDLLEEVARVYGYNRFRNTLPSPMPVLVAPDRIARERVRSMLLAMGWTEAISTTFAAEEESAVVAGDVAHPVRMENPLSEEAGLLRPSLVPGMLTMLAANLHRDVREVRLFEQGTVFRGTTADAAEVEHATSLVLGMTTATAQGTALYGAEVAPVYALKGVVESLAGLFATAEGALQFSGEGAPEWMEAGRRGVATIGGQRLASFGELARGESARRKLRQPVFVLVVEMEALLRLPLKRAMAGEISRFQAVERDFSFVFADAVQWHTVRSAVESLALPDVTGVEPVEIFRDPKGKAIERGRYSLLVRVRFQSRTRTLEEEELQAASGAIAGALTALGGQQRA